MADPTSLDPNDPRASLWALISALQQGRGSPSDPNLGNLVDPRTGSAAALTSGVNAPANVPPAIAAALARSSNAAPMMPPRTPTPGWNYSPSNYPTWPSGGGSANPLAPAPAGQAAPGSPAAAPHAPPNINLGYYRPTTGVARGPATWMGLGGQAMTPGPQFPSANQTLTNAPWSMGPLQKGMGWPSATPAGPSLPPGAQNLAQANWLQRLLGTG